MTTALKKDGVAAASCVRIILPHSQRYFADEEMYASIYSGAVAFVISS